MKKKSKSPVFIFTLLLLCIICGVMNAQKPVRNIETQNTQKCCKVRPRYVVNEMNVVNNKSRIETSVSVTVRANGRIKIEFADYQSEVVYYIYKVEGHAIIRSAFCGYSTDINFDGYDPGEYRLQLIDIYGAERDFSIMKIK